MLQYRASEGVIANLQEQLRQREVISSGNSDKDRRIEDLSSRLYRAMLQYRASEGVIANLQAQLREGGDRTKELTDQNTRLARIMAQFETQIRDLRKSLQECNSSLESSKGTQSENEGTIKTLRSTISKLGQSGESCKELRDENSRLGDRLKNIENDLKQASTKRDEYKSQLDFSNTQKDEYKTQTVETLNRLRQAESERDQLREQKATLDARIGELTRACEMEKQAITNERGALLGQVRDLDNRGKLSEERAQKLEKQLKEYDVKIKECNEMLAKMESAKEKISQAEERKEEVKMDSQKIRDDFNEKAKEVLIMLSQKAEDAKDEKEEKKVEQEFKETVNKLEEEKKKLETKIEKEEKKEDNTIKNVFGMALKDILKIEKKVAKFVDNCPWDSYPLGGKCVRYDSNKFGGVYDEDSCEEDERLSYVDMKCHPETDQFDEKLEEQQKAKYIKYRERATQEKNKLKDVLRGRLSGRRAAFEEEEEEPEEDELIFGREEEIPLKREDSFKQLTRQPSFSGDRKPLLMFNQEALLKKKAELDEARRAEAECKKMGKRMNKKTRKCEDDMEYRKRREMECDEEKKDYNYTTDMCEERTFGIKGVDMSKLSQTKAKFEKSSKDVSDDEWED